MLTFVKGDPDNLIGRAAVYLHNRKGSRNSVTNSDYLAMFIAGTPEDATVVLRSYNTKLPPELDKEVKEILTGVAGVARDDNCRDVYGLFLPIFRTDDLSSIDADVIRAPDIDNPGPAYAILHSASTLYMALYDSRKGQGYISQLKRYGQIERGEFAKQLVSLTQEVLRAVEVGSDYKRAASDLKHTTEGAPFAADMDAFLEAARSRNQQLATLQMKKVIAVVFEDYDTAAETRDEINRLKISAQTAGN